MAAGTGHSSVSLLPRLECTDMIEDRPADPPPAISGDVPEATQKSQLGYGHRAHSPDPNATYAFNPGQPRLLPRDKSKRWTVPG